MPHPKFVQILTGTWDGERGHNHTLYALDETGEVWKLYQNRWVVVNAPREEGGRSNAGRNEAPRGRQPF